MASHKLQNPWRKKAELPCEVRGHMPEKAEGVSEGETLEWGDSPRHHTHEVLILAAESRSVERHPAHPIVGTGGAPDIIHYLKERLSMHQKIESLHHIDSKTVALFRSIDNQHTDDFLAHLAPDCRFRFGSAPALSGSEAIRQSVDGLFSAIHSVTHVLETVWRNESVVIVRGRVRYVFKAGQDVEIPFCDVLELDSAGLIRNYEIYSELGT